ncbi:uncharacterized protein LOC117245993 [Epinephelus lanceolatus]|uniref:pectinesterase inhibitor 10-like n=1 Tax=Epinephelus lanceolatus TaxID=310571 RepID=UPI00144636B5|nr:pectinesterase inhibitor 10-like [Epinephelus lanceolatus]XP_033465529.1 pectinesterase inhibitor 10-like [Epinephelus lanceolatus]XP_033465530.1 pectinesterase inhibitor 10-like [Epinephelus lanceolatus]
MKSSSPPSSPSITSTSVTAAPDTQLLSSSSSPPPLPPLSLRSPQLQAEFLQERLNRFQSGSDPSESSVVSSAASPPPPLHSPFSPSPFASPCSSSSSSCSSSPCNNRQARLSLSSPELLSELKEARTRSLRHVPTNKGMTTVFSGRGRGGVKASGSAPSTRPASQKTSH